MPGLCKEYIFLQTAQTVDQEKDLLQSCTDDPAALVHWHSNSRSLDMPPNRPPPRLCSHCQVARAVLKRPKNHEQVKLASSDLLGHLEGLELSLLPLLLCTSPFPALTDRMQA